MVVFEILLILYLVSDVGLSLARIGDETTNFDIRSCPGSHIALSVVWLAAASLLTAFNIEKAVDAHGQPIEPTREYQSTAVS